MDYVVVLLQPDRSAIQQIFGPYTSEQDAAGAFRELAAWPTLRGEWEIQPLTAHAAPGAPAVLHQDPRSWWQFGPGIQPCADSRWWPTPTYPPGTYVSYTPTTTCSTAPAANWTWRTGPDEGPDAAVPART